VTRITFCSAQQRLPSMQWEALLSPRSAHFLKFRAPNRRLHA
jgi:hypothetical protein